ncbi:MULTISPECIES: zinc-dependent alcohol dehydrogenase [Streptosporangium]|uniref:Threonine dehydrogenase-like Zn-dependent dehydrogenase n=1 Tax=Streptosporangium brasiliense TaxID=47480 RepID=A0ABT9RE87_9ACTN|nr:alcohol dehydrogenase catalytic domain-containing protein [Streptosporangium brasiliense]MDP9867572.1 threonine dehydrogenase-like Zn-dependent dehydrogenase [Streptosporangium brasiliense]
MRAFVVTGPRRFAVQDVEPPVPAPGQVVVDVERAGVCGTDAEFFSGDMDYLREGQAGYPMRIGHEWCGSVSAVGEGVDASWIGRRVTGDTMLGCGRCRRCRTGLQHVCEDRFEIGIRGGWPGALAEQLPVPVTALHALPDTVDAVAGAMVEPGGNALRAVEGAALGPDARVLVLGPGTIGLLAARFALAQGVEVHVMGLSEPSLDFARTLGVHGAWTSERLPDLPFDAVIDAANSPALPARALDLVEPGRRVVYIGLASAPSTVDTRTMVLKDVTAVGVLSGSPGLAGAIEHYASGTVDPRPLVAATIGLDGVGDVLAGRRPTGSGPGPKIHVDPRL